MIYVTGDTHGDVDRLFDKELKKLKKDDTLIICGDFGFVWDGSDREMKILDELGNRRYNVLFVDGTHENYELLNSKFRMTVWNKGRVHRVSGTCFHALRGEIFEIEGNRIFTFGGGESRDKEMRLEQGTWYREEMPSAAEMESGAEKLDEYGDEVDYIITHEPPSLVKSTMLLRSSEPDEVNKLNGYLEQLNRACRFKHWYFGSMHEDKVVTPVHTAVFRHILPIK
ncbi:MAG: metallophosphoesterase [Clostridia bacterium]|nr:metallophosphoesterase [Clostridia bacterium]